MKLTERHFKKFVDRCWYWIDRFHAGHIEWYFENSPNENDSYAEYDYSREAGQCIVRFTIKDVELSYREYIEDVLDEIAFHEICEVVIFGKMRDMLIEAGYITKINEITHESLHRLGIVLNVSHGSKR